MEQINNNSSSQTQYSFPIEPTNGSQTQYSFSIEPNSNSQTQDSSPIEPTNDNINGDIQSTENGSSIYCMFYLRF